VLSPEIKKGAIAMGGTVKYVENPLRQELGLGPRLSYHGLAVLKKNFKGF
jgi:hypothetical protein